MMNTLLGSNAYVDLAMADDAKTAKPRDQRFAFNLDALLVERDLVARRVGEQAGVGESEFTRYRKGRVVPPVSTAADIAAVLGVSLDDLMQPLPKSALERATVPSTAEAMARIQAAEAEAPVQAREDDPPSAPAPRPRSRQRPEKPRTP